MFKKPSKKKLLIRRIALSAIATFAVIIIATSTILFMLGYRLDSGNGRLEQGALLQFDSTPNGGDVYIDDRNIGSRTATKQNVIAGTHTVKMTKAGYQDWQRTLDIVAGTLTWLDYTRFIPNDRPVETVTTYESLVSLEFADDNRWALAHTVAATPRFELLDLRSQEVKSSTLELPATSFTAPPEDVEQSFMISSWDSGGRYVLLKHLYADQVEWIVLDTQNVEETINVTSLLGVGFRDLQFAGTNGKALYGLSNDGTIRELDLSGATISRAFVTNAETFSIYDNTIITYVGLDPRDATKRVAGIYRDGDEASHILRSMTASDTPLRIATSRYYTNDYVAIAEGNVVTILRGNYPSSSAQDNSSLARFATFELNGAVSALTFSPKGDFVFAQSGESYKSYEIEHTRSAAGMITVPEGQAASTLAWLDTAHLWNDDNGSLTMRDFDGSNVYEIMKVTPGYNASLSQNGRYFYAVGTSDEGIHVQRVKMILD